MPAQRAAYPSFTTKDTKDTKERFIALPFVLFVSFVVHMDAAQHDLLPHAVRRRGLNTGSTLKSAARSRRADPGVGRSQIRFSP
ncbi:MAG: hypothetical protein AB1716_21310, partial [Planctomycetota bacterium]